MEYKLPPEHRGRYNGWMDVPQFQVAPVLAVKPWRPPKWHRRENIRYCVEVDHPTHRYFTSGGLVSNSDFGPWKHWGKQEAREGPYAAADALQTYRTAVWLVTQLIDAGMWEMFLRDWHERDQYVLRPARLQGVPIDRPELEAFHLELQEKLAGILTRIKATAAAGVRKPALGYATRPRGTPCATCSGLKKIKTQGTTKAGKPKTVWVTCDACDGVGHDEQPQPPVSIIGKPTRGGAEAKTQYLTEGVELVYETIDTEVRVCLTCGAANVGTKHRCPRSRTRRTGNGEGNAGLPPVPRLDTEQRRVQRWFWQLPFNPDAPQQILAYLASQGEHAPLARKTRKPTTDKDAMKALVKKYGEADPFYQCVLDWKAVTKVDGTYVVGVLTRLDENDCVHPEITPKPGTLRDSCVGPNFQNVVADREGPASLAAGFRRAVVPRDGVPGDRTAKELDMWEQRWGEIA